MLFIITKSRICKIFVSVEKKNPEIPFSKSHLKF